MVSGELTVAFRGATDGDVSQEGVPEMEASLQTQGLEARSKLKSHSYSKEVKAKKGLPQLFEGDPQIVWQAAAAYRLLL